MTHHSRPLRLAVLVGFGILATSAGCGDGGEQPVPDSGTPPAGGAGGSVGSGGTASTGGTTSSGGTTGTGGATAGAGGRSGSGGTTSAGGRSARGGATSAGGASDRGGATSAGGSAPPPDGSPPPDSSSLPEAGTETGGGTPGVRLEGRFDMTDATKPSFGWSGSAMIARFQGTGASLRIDQSPNQYTVVVDGTVSSTVLKTGSGTTYPLATGLPAGVHDVIVWRRTEGNQGESRFLGLDVTGGQLLAPPAAPDRRIEIYGDSITAGYGIDGAGPSCPWSADTENHYLTYGAITARELKADLHTIAWSGIGMYRNYGVSAASADAMPAVYARTLPTKSGSTWDFKTWQPHAVVINLGTNDASTSGDPGTPYRTAYLEFVRGLRGKYPDTFFVLTIGPMLDGSSLTAIKTHLQALIQTRAGEGDSKMSFLEFPVQAEADGYGCDWHPSPKTNTKMATLLVAELKKRLGW